MSATDNGAENLGADAAAGGLGSLLTALEAQFHGGTCGCSGCCGTRIYEGDGFDDTGAAAVYELRAVGAAAAAETGGGVVGDLRIIDFAGVSDTLIGQVEATFDAVFELLSTFINGRGVLDLRVEIEEFDSESLTLASALLPRSGFERTTNAQGVTVETPGTIFELNTGVDPNGAATDGVITIGREFLETAFIEADPLNGGEVPFSQIDFFSVILHEMLHILGFFGFRDPNSFQLSSFETPSAFDAFVEFDDQGRPVFVGPNAVAVYGAPVPLESTRGPGSNIYHIGDEPTGDQAGAREDLDNALISAAASFGDREIIGSLELAILRDLGLDVTIPEDLQIIDFLDGGMFPTLGVEAEVVGGERIFAFEGDGILDLTIIRDGLANGLPSVGFELISGSAAAGEDFTAQRDRFVFVPQTLDGPVTIELIDDDVFDGAETFTLRLFNPANSFFENGGLFQDFEIVIIDNDTPVGVRDEADVLRFLNVETGVHVFTADTDVQNSLFADAATFFFEGVGFESLDAETPGAAALFRFENADVGSIFLTLNQAEADAFAAANPDFTQTTGETILASADALAGTLPVFRFFNTSNGGYFYTQDADEAEFIRTNLPGFEDQGVAFFAAVNTADVLRFFDFDLGVHIFTTDVARQSQLATQPDRFFFEGVGFESLDATATGALEVFSLVDPRNGSSFFTIDAVEAAEVTAANPNFIEGPGAPIFASATDTEDTDPVFAFLNTVTGAFLYTQSVVEADAIRATEAAFEDLGVVFFAPAPSPEPAPAENEPLEGGAAPLLDAALI